MPRVLMGNLHPIFNGQAISDSTAITDVSVPDSKSLDHMLRDIAHEDGLWRVHSADAAPSWVECPASPELEAALADRFGCPVGRPARSE